MTAISQVSGPAPGGAVRAWSPARLTAFASAAAVAALVALPLLGLVRMASRGDADIWPHLAAYVLPTASVQTILLLAGVAAMAGSIGITSAWLVTMFRFPGRNLLLWLLPLPLAIPTYISAYIYVDILDAAGPVQTALRSLTGWSATEYWFPPIRSLGGAIFVMGMVLYPYVYLAARVVFQTQCAVFSDSARVVGAGPWRLLCDVSLPLARPALAVGLSLALLETLNDIGACEYLGVPTLTLSVFTTWLNRGSLPGAAQIALSMLILVAGVIALERYGRRRQSYASAAEGGRLASRLTLRGRRAWLAFAACLAPAAFGFLLPAAFLLREAVLLSLAEGVDPALFGHVAATVGLAAAATAAVLLLALAVTLPQRLLPHPFLVVCVTVATMGYAIPGTVLALGLLSPVVAVDDVINWVSEAASGATVGLVLAGSSAALVIAYAVRFMAIGIGFVQAGLTRVPIEYDEAARVIGAGSLALIRSTHLPLLRPALSGAALLVFVDCMKELPMTLLLRPLNVETLSTFIYQFAARGSFEQGALAAVLIVAVGIFPVIRLIRLTEAAPAETSRLRL